MFNSQHTLRVACFAKSLFFEKRRAVIIVKLRQTLCDKRDNNFVGIKFPSIFLISFLYTDLHFCKRPGNMNVK